MRKSLQLADLILRATPYCLSDEMGLAICLRCTFGLRAALGILQLSPRHSEKLPSCQTMLAQLTDKRGVSFTADIARQYGKWRDTKDVYAQ